MTKIVTPMTKMKGAGERKGEIGESGNARELKAES